MMSDGCEKNELLSSLTQLDNLSSTIKDKDRYPDVYVQHSLKIAGKWKCNI